MKELFEKEAMSLATEVTDNSNVNKEANNPVQSIN